jgi:hypothetical protein
MVSDNNKIYFLITNGLESSNVIGTYVNWAVIVISMILIKLKFRYHRLSYMLLYNISFLVLIYFFSFILLACL